jgi:hypothetical protein
MRNKLRSRAYKYPILLSLTSRLTFLYWKWPWFSGNLHLGVSLGILMHVIFELWSGILYSSVHLLLLLAVQHFLSR